MPPRYEIISPDEAGEQGLRDEHEVHHELVVAAAEALELLHGGHVVVDESGGGELVVQRHAKMNKWRDGGAHGGRGGRIQWRNRGEEEGAKKYAGWVPRFVALSFA